MGNFTIVITGTGSHHGGNDFDADAIAKLLVAALITKGHSIDHASITCSSRQDIRPTAEVIGSSQVHVGGPR
jgi:hypothetical protein